MPAAITGHDTHDPVLVKLIHGKSAGGRNAFLSMLNKEAASHELIAADYIKHWEANEVSKDDDNVPTKTITIHMWACRGLVSTSLWNGRACQWSWRYPYTRIGGLRGFQLL